MSKFGAYLKELRMSRNMSLRDVEKVVKLSNSYLSQLEKGDRGIPTLKTMQKLAQAYGMEVSELTKVAENEKKLKKGYKLPKADAEFICRGYSNLNDEDKDKVKDFIDFLGSKKK